MHHRPPFEPGMLAFVSRTFQEFVGFMHTSGLSAPQIHLLMYLYHQGECQVSDIARLMDASAPAASQFVDRLWQQGLVTRDEDPTNRRTRLIRLSEKGQALVTQGIVSNGFLSGLFSHLTPEQIETIHTALGYLAKATAEMQSEHAGQTGQSEPNKISEHPAHNEHSKRAERRHQTGQSGHSDESELSTDSAGAGRSESPSGGNQ